MASQNPERDRAIVLMREGGMTLREIGKEIGLSADRVRCVVTRAWCDAQPLEYWRPHDRIYRFAPSARVGHVILDAVWKAYGNGRYEIPDDISPEKAARAVARLRRGDVLSGNIGRKTVAEVEKWLAGFSLTFAGEEEPIWWT